MGNPSIVSENMYMPEAGSKVYLELMLIDFESPILPKL
jgi:hypothetical protein